MNNADLIKYFELSAKVFGAIFSVGMAWSLLKTLKETVSELKESHKSMLDILHAHETRISVLESKRMRK